MINTLERGKTEGSARGQTSAGNTGRGVAGISDRKHLTSREVERLMEATKDSRNEVRDRCLLLLMFRHGLRVSEACRMKLDQVEVERRVLHVARLKGGISTTRRRTAGRGRMAERTRAHEADRQDLLCQ